MDYVRWTDSGVECWALRPEDKHKVILDYARRYGLRKFFETGTFSGNCVEAMRGHFDQIISVELSRHYYEQAWDRFRDYPQIAILYGNSSTILAERCIGLGPTLFWLDAHCSGGDTAGGVHPIAEELTAIFESKVTGVILVDDCQDFWQNSVPEKAIETIEKYPGWQHEVKDGIMRIFEERK